MSETEPEPDEPRVKDVPEPDQEPNEPEPDPEPETPETPGDEPGEASQPKSEKDIDRALKAVERAGVTYRRAIDKAMGEDALGLLPCPRCNAPVAGLVFPPDVAPVDDETRAAVLASIGQGVETQRKLRAAEGVVMCDRCDGYGELEFPTRNPHVKTQMCPVCTGQGYKSVEQPQATVYTPDAWQVQTTTSPAGEITYSVPDSWGRPFGHRHYGVPPAEVG